MEPGKARNYCTLTLSVGYSVPQRQKQRVDFLLVSFFSFLLIFTIFNQGAHRERQGEERERGGGIILHLPQYVSSLIKDEQLSVMQLFFLFCPD